MNRSSRFISLSGLSGIFAGIYALAGAGVAYWLVNSSGDAEIIGDQRLLWFVLMDLAAIAILSIVTAVYITTKRARKEGVKMWDQSSKRLIVNFLIPMVAGGAYILILLLQQKFGHTGALMLLFYGLALVNASKYSIGHIRYLGFAEIILGLTAAIQPLWGFWLWVIGFGFFHIIYGTIMYLHEKK